MEANKPRRKIRNSDRKGRTNLLRDIFTGVDPDSDQQNNNQPFEQITVLEDDGSLFSGMSVVNDAYFEQQGKLLNQKVQKIHQASNYVRNDMYYGTNQISESTYDVLINESAKGLVVEQKPHIVVAHRNQLSSNKQNAQTREFYKPPAVEQQIQEQKQIDENGPAVPIIQSSNSIGERRGNRTTKKKKTTKKQRNILEGLSDPEEEETGVSQQRIEQPPKEEESEPKQVTPSQEDQATELPQIKAPAKIQQPPLQKTPKPQKLRSRSSSSSSSHSNRGKATETEQSVTAPVESVALFNSLSTHNQMKDFYYRPIAKNSVFHCILKRITEGFKARFQLFFMDDRPMMAAENTGGAIGCNYHISLNREMDKKTKYYMGKVRSDVYGSMYSVYDGGENPKNTKDKKLWRMTHANVKYESNFMGVRGPRKLQTWSMVYSNKEADNQLYKLSDGVHLSDITSQCTVHNFKNKEPKWNDKLNSYALNFGGRVKIASIKNFILTDPQKEEGNYLIFGKAEDGVFSLSFMHPFSPFQAFGIALTSFDFKLTCQ